MILYLRKKEKWKNTKNFGNKKQKREKKKRNRNQKREKTGRTKAKTVRVERKHPL